MNWYRTKKASLDNDALRAEADPFLDAGIIEETGKYYDPHWYKIVGTDYYVFAEEDSNPYNEGMYTWQILDDPGNALIGHEYELEKVLEKHSPMLKKKTNQAEGIDVVLEKLYDIGSKSDPRAAPWLEKYRKMTGEQFPKFMY